MKKTPRPPAVSSACLFVGLGSALLLVYVTGWLTSWGSLEMQDVHQQVADAFGAADPESVADAMRYGLYALVVVLVAGMVGAIYAARGDLPSRMLVTGVAAVAGLLFVMTGGLFGFIPAAFAVAAIVQLWGRDARRWFAQVNGRPLPADPILAPLPPPSHSSADVPGAPGMAPTGVAVRPSAVRTSILVTLIASSLALVGSLAYLAIYFVMSKDELVRIQMESPFFDMVNMTEADLRSALTTSAVFCGITAVLSIAAMLAAWGLARRNKAAHTALFVCAVVTAGIGVFSIVGIPWAVTAIWVAILLRHRDTLQWLRG